MQVIDAPGRPAALGEVSVSVRSKPDAAAAPVAVADRILGSSARVDFRPPAYDGGLPIQGYEVTAIGPGGGAKACSSSPCTITGLTNGQDYSFTVRSRNPVGWSDQSPPSNTVRPDTKPEGDVDQRRHAGRPQAHRAAGPSRPTRAARCSKYRVQWVNIGGSAGATGQADGPGPGADEGRHRPDQQRRLQRPGPGQQRGGLGSLRARGQGAVVRQAGRRAGADPEPARRRCPARPNAQVSISWPATDPNGPAITKYDVFRRTGGGAWSLIATRSGGDSRVASDTVPYQGQTVRVRRDRDQRRSGDVRQGQLPELHGQRLPRQARHHARRHPARRQDRRHQLHGGSRARGRWPAGHVLDLQRRPRQLQLCVRVVHPDHRRASRRIADDHGDDLQQRQPLPDLRRGVHLAVRLDPGRAQPPRLEQGRQQHHLQLGDHGQQRSPDHRLRDQR